MLLSTDLTALLLLAAVAPHLTDAADELRFDAPDFLCPEKNGKFPDQEECDLYYDCKDDIAEAVYCKNGLVFDISRPNREKCDYPHKVDCSERPKTQPAPPGLDPKCQRENGYFDVEGDCTNYYNCDNGVPYVFPCAQTLVFDVGAGTCVRVQDKSPAAQNCTVVKEEAAFICPKGTAVGPQGLVQAHPIYPHPEDCQYYYNCIDDGVSEEKVAREFGCPGEKVFDRTTQVCKEVEEVPECACWWRCDQDCEFGCKPNCDCRTEEEALEYPDYQE